MTNPICKEMEPLWDRYLRGECTPEEERQAEEHLEQCPACQERLDQAMAAQAPLVPPTTTEQAAPSSGKQQRWMRRAKWRNRVSTAVNLLSAFILLSILSGITTGLLYGLGGSSSTSERLPKVLGTAVGMTVPNLNVNSGGVSTGFYFNLSMDYKMSKQVGRQEQLYGILHGDMRFNLLNVKREWFGGGYQSNLYFAYPETPGSLTDEDRQYERDRDNDVWKALEMLPEGTVSELAVSLDAAYSLEEIYAMFQTYDMDIVWYAFDTGLEQDSARQGNFLSGWSGELWGMSSDLMLRYASYSSGLKVWGDGPAKEQAFLRGLQELQKNERWVRKLVHADPKLQKRIEYVSEHGARSYGLIVTGPTKELLKLRENVHITRPALGETDWWNWYQTSYSSVQY
ncbi:anti sigma factor C-terminal domain-containing protein [Paenibacillus sp. NPDC057967]|uniref:anti sigma factor C-terminal domain-containing protein n=1 Tax=Paenibacillus sp. NPDC057967 TaxID=3346293 RepID=UPI0036D9F3A6